MPALTPEQWVEVERLYIENSIQLRIIAERFNISISSISGMASSRGWPPRRGARRSAGDTDLDSQRRTLARLRKAIETTLTMLELRMHKQLATARQAAKASPDNPEREARALGTLIKNHAKITEMAADLQQRIRGKPASRDAAALFAEAERYRRELARRLAKFVPAAAEGPAASD